MGDTLDKLHVLHAELDENANVLVPPYGEPGQGMVTRARLHCVQCGDFRRMNLWVLYAHRPEIVVKPYLISEQNVVLCALRCVECNTRYTLVKYPSPAGSALVVLSSVHGGLSSPNAPEAVRYYLDQAHRAESMGAHSAAVAMYRAALEQLLYEQGFQSGMLAAKIVAVEKAKSEGSGPRWAVELETDYLAVIKELGNGAIHPNDGDITRQAAFDRELVTQLELTFAGLLFLVYEAPIARTKKLAALKARAALLKR